MQKRKLSSSPAIVVWLMFVVTTALAPLPLTAQTSLGTSSVGGMVFDPSALGVPGAAVQLFDTQRGTTRNTVTNQQGAYLFTAVLPGIYTLRVQQKGFREASIQNVRVIIDQLATVNVTLQVGTISQSVTVNSAGSTPLLDTTTNSLGTVMSNVHVEQLPLNGRDFLQLATLVSGSQEPTGGSDMVTAQTGHSNMTISVTGANQFETSYFIDGIATRGSRIGNSSINESVAAIDQFKIELGFFMPDLGPNAGIVDVLTKSGTNAFHGEAYEFLRNTVMNGTNYFATKPQILQRNQFGVSVGGPIIIPKLINGRNKLWFFTNYEGTRQVTQTVASAYAPTQAMMNGDFSGEASSITIYNPFSYDAATGTRAPFAGNIIPPNLINPISTKLLSYYLPGTNYNERPNNLVGYPRDTFNDNQFTIRTDATINPQQSLFATVIHENSPVINLGLMPLTGASFPLVSDLAVLQHTLVIGSNIVNIARLGWNRILTQDNGQGESGPALEKELGIPGTVDPHGIPGIGIAGFSGFGRSSGLLGNTDNNYQLNDALNYSRGKHNISFGIGIYYVRSIQNNANANSVGSLTFNPVFSAQLAPGPHGPTPVPGTGNALADFLLGMPVSGAVVGFQPMHYSYAEYFPHFQDSWRLTPNLTINYGMSWDYASVPKPLGPDAKIPHDFNFSTGLLQYAGLGQVSPQIVKPDYTSFTPRLGFAWQPGFVKNTVIRAGAGMYYSQKGLIETQFTYLAPPFETAHSFTNNQFSPLPTYYFGNPVAADNVFPVVPLQPLTDTFAKTLPSGFTPFAVNPNSRVPYVTQWTASVQHTFGRNDMVEADYIGNSAHEQQNRYDANQCATGVGDSRAAAAIPANLFCNNADKPYPNYGFILYSNTNGNMSYEALSLKYQHQLSQGLTILGNYTYSKTLSDSWETATSTVNQIATCRRCDKGPVSYDIPQQFIVSAIYELPFGRGRMLGNNMPRAVDLFLGGWRIGDITTFSTGSAFTVTSPNNTGAPFTQVRANRLCNGKDSHFSGNLRSNGFIDFNTACFATPAPGYFGTSPRGVLFGPGTDNSDMSIAKQVPLVNRLTFELRGEFFNAFNHTNFGNPDSNTGDRTFGRVSNAADPRLIQVAGRLIW
ncbi:MAG: carboxypeptidase-like regulatory domain-containing protein [Terriglobia bacterium]|nr:carboxypeptidase-like regulatory domain-containing protein [Terriglobia bacterium]